MGLALLVVLLALPLAELYVIVQVSNAIGFWNCIGLLLMLSLIGAWLLKRQGVTMWRRVQSQVNQGETAAATVKVADGFLGMVAAFLILVPGFITAAAGLLLFLPPIRAVVRRLVLGRISGRAVVIRSSYGGPVTDTTATSADEPPTRREIGGP